MIKQYELSLIDVMTFFTESFLYVTILILKFRKIHYLVYIPFSYVDVLSL